MTQILTEKTLAQFIPLLQQYLKQQGWHKVKENDVLSIWNKVESPSLATLLRLPNVIEVTEDKCNFTLSTLQKLADHLNSSVEFIVQAVYDNKPAAQLGKISVRVIADDVQNGQIAFQEGLSLFQTTKNFVENFAKSTWKKKAYHSNGKAVSVVEFMSTLKLGQTQQGSYIVNVYYPIEQSLGNSAIPETSFSAQVNQNIASGLAALSEHLNQSDVESIDIGEFIQKGISANLCNTLIHFSGKNQHRDVEITLHAINTNEQNQVFTLPKAKIPDIEHISTQLAKDEFWFEKYEVIGKVIDRHSLSGGIEEGGKISVRVEIYGRVRTIHIDLNPMDYKLANEATNQGKPLRLIGKLHIKQQKGEMTDLTRIQIWENPSLPL